MLETRTDGAIHYSIQSPPVQTLSNQLETNYQAEYKKHCEVTGTVYNETMSKKHFEGNFRDELCLGNGTVFLIGKQLVLTAAHCICDPSTGIVSRIKLAGLLVIFGFQMQSSDQLQDTFEQRDVYHIDAVWNYMFKKNVADWAIVKLDREVEGRDLLTFADSSTIRFQTQLYMLGHPLGLPLKLTMGAEVKERIKTKKTHEIKEEEAPLFEADLDAFAGNSGSPVFELERGTIIAMLFAGNPAQFKSDNNGIYIEQVSKQMINSNGYEKCLNIASIDFLKTVLSSSFKMGHTHFSGRMLHLTKLKNHLIFPSAFTRVYILYGPGGVGKSELAITFANNSIKDFSFIWSISCGTDEEKWIGYHGLAKRLHVYLADKETLHSLINKVHRKLEQNESKPWLLLFDNLQKSPDPMTDPTLPNKGGVILITSYKSPKIHTLPEDEILATEVLPLEHAEALEFLEKVTEKPLDDCKKLLNHIGCYPLMLGQVAGYIKYTKIEVEDYLAGLEKYQTLLVNQGNASKTSGMTLEAAFSMTLQQLSLSAKKWLFLCSQLNAAHIPVSYLKAWLDSEDILEEQSVIIAALEEHALLRYNVQEEAFSLHLEFQKILKSLAARDLRDEVAHLLVNVKDDWDFENTSSWEETRKKAAIWASHAEPIVKAPGRMPLDGLEKAYLLVGLSKWEYYNGRAENALVYDNEALEIRKAILGKNHPDVAASLCKIGNYYALQGDYKEALKLHSEALKIRRAFLAENHPDIAKSLTGMAYSYKSLGNSEKAMKLFDEALEINRIAFGDNHPQVAKCLSNIGECYRSQENYTAALKLHEEALKIFRTTLGENHVDIGVSLSSFNLCYYFLENYNEAIRVSYEALEIFRIACGENHFNVAMALDNIGYSYWAQKKYIEASKMFSEALKVYKVIYGENHSYIAEKLKNIKLCQARRPNPLQDQPKNRQCIVS
jgi:tetratricopeptide (TPR) repeat protein